FLFSKKQAAICSGANLAYRRSAFLKVKGYLGNGEHLSGDDEFLLKKIVRHFGTGSAVYINEAEALVKTAAEPGLTSFVQQRVRWASKWRMHGLSPNFNAALFTVALAVFQVGSILLIFGGYFSQLVFLAFWFFKVLTEIKVLGGILKQYKIHPRILS